MDDRPKTILDATRTFWPRFAPLWCVPIVNFAGIAVLANSAFHLWFFWLVSAPMFFWAFFRAAQPWIERRIRYTHFAVLAFLMPFAIFIVVAGSAAYLSRRFNW